MHEKAASAMVALRRSLREARILNGLLWMMIVAGVGTAGDALIATLRRP